MKEIDKENSAKLFLSKCGDKIKEKIKTVN
jgi:hypothetical protein